MGANLVTAYWDPSDKDTDLKSSLREIALRHGVSIDVDPNMSRYVPGKIRFSSEISGFSIPWHGGQATALETLHNIKKEWEVKLDLSEVEGYSVTVESLPM